MTRCSFAAKNGFDNYIFKFDVPSPFHHEEGHAETGNMQQRDTKKKQTAMQKQAITRQNKNMLKRTSMPRATTKKPDIPGH